MLTPKSTTTTSNTVVAATTPLVATLTSEATTKTTTAHLEKWVRNFWEFPLPKPKYHCWPMDQILLQLPDIPHGDYITAVEQACLNLEPHNAEELRAEIRGALRYSHKSRRSITKEEAQALSELKKINQESSLQLTKE